MRVALRAAVLVATLPVGAIGLLGVLLSLLNLDPQRELFAHSLVVRNRLSHSIQVTPIDGQDPERPRVVRDDGTRLITPLPPFRGGGIRIEAGARHLIKYDSDDQLVTVLLLESPSGEVRSLPIEWERAEYNVVTLADLPLADPRAVRAARRVARIWVLLPLCIGALLSPLVASYWWWRGRNHDGNALRPKECRAAEQGDEADER